MATVYRVFELTDTASTVETPPLRGWRLYSARFINSRVEGEKFTASGSTLRVFRQHRRFTSIEDLFLQDSNGNNSPFEFDEHSHYPLERADFYRGNRIQSRNETIKIYVNGPLTLELTTTETGRKVYVEIGITDDKPGSCGERIPEGFRA